MQERKNRSGMLTLNRPVEPITDPVEARRVINADILKRAKQARSHFRIAPVEERTWNGIVFASWHEKQNHAALVEQENLGIISNLRRQVPYELSIGGFKITTYIADHVYFDHTLQREIVADTKGKRTESFRIKKRLMKLIYNIEVIEI